MARARASSLKAPQVLQRAAAPGQDQDVALGPPVGQLQGREQRSPPRPGPLHLDRVDQDRQGRQAAPEHAQDVVDRGPDGRGDEPHLAREGRDRALGGSVEEPLGGEPALEPLQLQAQGPLAGRLQVLAHQLEIAAGLEQADPGPRQDLLPVGRAEAEQQALGAGTWRSEPGPPRP